MKNIEKERQTKGKKEGEKYDDKQGEIIGRTEGRV